MTASYQFGQQDMKIKYTKINFITLFLNKISRVPVSVLPTSCLIPVSAVLPPLSSMRFSGQDNLSTCTGTC